MKDESRTRIVAAAIQLLAEGGGDAVTTRAVAAAADVQAPAIYRLFGDKEGLLDAVAEQALADFVARKRADKSGVDPVESLRKGFMGYTSFGLENPEVFVLIYGRPGRTSKAAVAGLAVLRDRIHAIALAGRLTVSEERAVDLCHAMAKGTVLEMLGRAPEARRGMAEAARDAVLGAILKDAPVKDSGVAAAVSTLRAHLADLPGLTAGEKQLMHEWLVRVADPAPRQAPTAGHRAARRT